MKRLCVLTVLLSMACSTAYADAFGIRGAVADVDAKEDFNAYEAFVVFDLPWAWQPGTSRLQTQLEITGGEEVAPVSGPNVVVELGQGRVDRR